MQTRASFRHQLTIYQHQFESASFHESRSSIHEELQRRRQLALPGTFFALLLALSARCTPQPRTLCLSLPRDHHSALSASLKANLCRHVPHGSFQSTRFRTYKCATTSIFWERWFALCCDPHRHDSTIHLPVLDHLHKAVAMVLASEMSALVQQVGAGVPRCKGQGFRATSTSKSAMPPSPPHWPQRYDSLHSCVGSICAGDVRLLCYILAALCRRRAGAQVRARGYEARWWGGGRAETVRECRGLQVAQAD
jgi:hypothetical protein